MSEISNHFPTDSCLLVLGSVGDILDRIPVPVRSHKRVFFLDAVNESASAEGVRTELIRGIVAPAPGPVRLTVRNFPLCSSIPDISADVVENFGLQDYARPTGVICENANTISEIAARYGVIFDYIKTDIEGMDGPVIMSLGPLLDSVLMITMELRFLPNYAGEPYFNDVVAYMRSRGFEILHLKVENWLYDVPGRDRDRRGRSVHADTTFVRNPGALSESQIVRLAGLLCTTGFHNFARHSIERTKGALRDELIAMIDASRPALRRAPLWRRAARRVKHAILKPAPPKWRFEHLERR